MEVEHEDQRIIAPRDFDGPVKKRRCTDFFWLLVLLACWAAMTGIGLATTGVVKSSHFNKGDPYRILRGIDYKGNLCGIDSPVDDLNNKYEPNNLGTNPSSTSDLVPLEFGICVNKCPKAGDTVDDPYGQYGSWVAPTDTTNILGYCIPIDNTVKERFAEETFADIIRARIPIGVLGIAMAAIAAFLFVQLIRIPFLLRLVVWGAILITFVVLTVGAIFVLDKANRKRESETKAEQESLTQSDLLKALGYVLAASAFLWMCITCFLRDRIGLAIGIIREAARAIGHMPILNFFPAIQLLGVTGFFIVWLIFSLYLVSSGELETHTTVGGITYKTIHYDQNARKAIIFMLFMWFWTSTFIQAVGQLTVALSLSRWYFCKTKSSSTSSHTVVQALGTTCRYHLGTAAFGSFVIAVVSMVRTTLLYIKKKFSGKTTMLAKVALHIMGCCLWCFDKCLRFLNKNAYIQTAIFGYSFCKGSRKAFFLIARNILRVGAVMLVGDFVMFVGKMCVTVLCGGVAYYYFQRYMEDDLNGVVLPTVVVAVLAFQTAHLLLEVVTMAASTILQCFVADEEMFAGIDCYAEQGLKEYIFDFGSGSKTGLHPTTVV